MKTFFLFLLILPLVTACASGPSKGQLDAEVDRLCAIDGGIRVYEIVSLPPDKFDKHGRINFYRPTQKENSLGSEYIFKWDIHYYKKGDPLQPDIHESSMKRDHIQIIRKSDMKLLGEFVLYRRSGGDVPGPWAPSSYRCPGLEENENILMNRMFKSVDKGDE